MNKADIELMAQLRQHAPTSPVVSEPPPTSDPCSLSKSLNGFLYDYSKQGLTNEELAALLVSAKSSHVPLWIDRLFQGEHVNRSEARAALHPALRAMRGDVFQLNGTDVIPDVLAVREQMREFCDAVHAGNIQGATGKSIRHIVNIGIGGSDLGPRMAVQALARFHIPSVSVQFVANLDPADLYEAIRPLNAAETLFIVASKTFSTAETLQNAHSALRWITEQLEVGEPEALAGHFIGVTANPPCAEDFGIAPQRIFKFWDWAGGRYSMWSAIGLPIALAVGMDRFEELLAGARAMDEHFRYAPLENNIPVLMALIGTWNIGQRDAAGLSVVPYCHGLRLLPGYLQQLEMESNGKRVDNHGGPVSGMTAPIVFGDAGTNAQHAYFQMLHQGTRVIPTDFIAVALADDLFEGHHDQLLANCFAQSAALAAGREYPDTPHRTCPGGQPSNTIILPRLNPYYLGMLLAMYEHKVFVQGVVWGINSFDQWGVELGKSLAKEILPVLQGVAPPDGLSSSTAGLIEHVRQLRVAEATETRRAQVRPPPNC